MASHGGKLEYVPWPEDDDPFESPLPRSTPASTSSMILSSRTVPKQHSSVSGSMDGVPTPSAELPYLPIWSDVPQNHRYTVVGVALLLLLALGWWGGSGQDVLDDVSRDTPMTLDKVNGVIPPASLPSAPLPSSSGSSSSSDGGSSSSSSSGSSGSSSGGSSGGLSLPSPSPPPGAGPQGPIVGEWGLHDAVLPHSLTFLSIGDWGRGGKGGQEITAPPLAAWARATKASFVVSVGDNVYVDGVPMGSSKEETDALMRSFFTDVYTDPALASLPFYAIFGNHDYRGNVPAQVEWKGDPRWRPGYNFTKRWKVGGGVGEGGGCVSAVFTDTTPLIKSYREGEKANKHPQLKANVQGADKEGIVAWTLGAVAKAGTSGCSAVLVFGHHPLYSPGEHSNAQDLIALYHTPLEEAGVDAYIAGHDHLLGHSRVPGGGVEHVLTGGGSEVRATMVPGAETLWVAPIRGFTVHSINTTHMATSYVWCGKETSGDTSSDLPGRIAFHSVRPLRKKGGKKGGGGGGGAVAPHAS